MKKEISIWGKWPEAMAGPFTEDYLWHDSVETVPQLGDVLSIDGCIFQVESIQPIKFDQDDDERFSVNVQSYRGDIRPTFHFGMAEN